MIRHTVYVSGETAHFFKSNKGSQLPSKAKSMGLFKNQVLSLTCGHMSRTHEIFTMFGSFKKNLKTLLSLHMYICSSVQILLGMYCFLGKELAIFFLTKIAN